jgi:hypothetical protein
MPSSIVTRLISGISQDKSLVLSNSYCARSMEIGTGWETIRVGWRMAISGSGDIGFQPKFTFGLCSGTGSIYGDAFTNSFFGFHYPYNNDSWTYSQSNKDVGTFSTPTFSQLAIIVKTGQLAPILDISNFSEHHPSTNITGGAQLYIFEISKPGAQTSRTFFRAQLWASLYILDGPSPNLFVSSGLFLKIMETTSVDTYLPSGYGTTNRTPLSIGGWSGGFSPAQVSGVFNSLDTINFYWNKTSHQLEIFDVAYSKIQ